MAGSQTPSPGPNSAAATTGSSRAETSPLLSVRDLGVAFAQRGAESQVVSGLSFDVYPGEVLGIVGESGSGKTVSMLSLVGLLPKPPARVTNGAAYFKGHDLITAGERTLERLRGGEIGMVFQDPVASLNPLQAIGKQVREAMAVHQGRAASSRENVVNLLRSVGIPEPSRRYDQYPHQFSGGMNQRVGIAIALANSPSLLIADEPTTALDVTIQAQILDLLRKARRDSGAAVILITHDLGLMAEIADRVLVMYAGRAVELGTVEQVLLAPRHPYTASLLRSLPQIERPGSAFESIPGAPPIPGAIPEGCSFHPRCFLSRERTLCRQQEPRLAPTDGADHLSACHFTDELIEMRDPAE